MKRALAVLCCATLTVAVGCGERSYERRLDKTLADMKYRQRLDQYLIPPVQGKFKELGIFLRPPKPLAQSTQFLLTSAEPGKYDLESSFFNQGAPTGLRLHVLARRKQAKKAPTKGAAPPADTANRGPFQQDVLSLLASNFGAAEALQNPRVQNVSAKRNAFKRITFPSPTGSDVRVYLYNRDPYDVALVWDIPKGTTSTGIDLCLESFAVGPKAIRQFEGGVGDEEAAGGKGTEASPTAF
jgi:hypothetical protein